MPSSDPPTSQVLEYPPVWVNHSLTKLDLNTLMMRSTTRRQLDEPGGSLGESTYELLGDSLLEISDDEARTESVASTNGRTPEDASDFSDDESDYEAANRDMHAGVDASPFVISDQPSDVHPTPSREDDGLMEGPTHLESSESWMIRLDEHPAHESETILGTKVIKSLSDHMGELPKVLSQYGSTQVRLVVRAALSQRTAPAPDAYKILYIGQPEKWLEDVLTSQIGAALTASPGISKSVMVRGQIEPYGPVIHVYRCAKIHVHPEHDKASNVLVRLDDGRQIEFGPGLCADTSIRPDLVIFCYPTVSRASDDVQDFAPASAIFDRQHIPSIDLAQARSYGEGAKAYDGKSLRVCMEGRNDASAAFELKEVLPIDYFTFSQLEPSQLNRHLAFISPHLLSSKEVLHGTAPRRTWLNAPFRKAFAKKSAYQWHSRKILAALVFLVITSALLRNNLFGLLLFQKPSVSWIGSDVLLQAPLSSSTTSLTIPSSQSAQPVAHMPSERHVTGDLTLVPPPGKPSKRRTAKKDRKAGGFNIRTTGNHQFVLSPSTDFSPCRGKPQLQIIISRDSQLVPARYNRTLSGEYVVDLERKYTIGSFNVSIATHSKPHLQQSFKVMLGHDRSRITRLLDTARTNFMDTQEYLWNVSSTAAQHVQASLADLEAAALYRPNGFRGHGADVKRYTCAVEQVMKHRVAAGVDVLKQASGRTWMGIRHFTAPIRTSSPMLKARMNALRLRCSMETAAGMSGRSSSEKQSWACLKVSQGKGHSGISPSRGH